jgi:hypothetical protein
MSQSLKGREVWNKGKKGCYSKETLEKISNAGKNRFVSEETRKKHSEASKKWHKEVGFSEEVIKRISEAKKGDKNPNYGKHPWNYGMKKNKELLQLNELKQCG